jgi:catechol 2,3-dioxygenase-like lactoylglutathione lyase family enzyme
MEDMCMRLFFAFVATALAGSASLQEGSGPAARSPGEQEMTLGNFSVSLAVNDLNASRAFYEKLGFRAIGGEASQNWLILQNDTATIGIFQGMFEKNMLTFNPGWDRTGQTLREFQDVREIQRILKERGLSLALEADERSSGPASLMLVDPDGNPILVDQHVPKPGE